MNLNYNIIFRICGITFLVVGIIMIPSALVAYFIGEFTVFKSFAYVLIPSLIAGMVILKTVKKSNSSLKFRDGYISVFSSIFLASILGGLPYLISGTLPPVESFFESVAGFTTTSASSIGEPNLPLSLAFFKALCHWFGGLGVLIYGISILPRMGYGGQQLPTAESANSNLNKIAPRTRDIIKIIFTIYLSLTLTTFVLVSLSRIGFVDSLICTFGTVSTAAVNINESGLLHYNSLYLEAVVSLFSIFSAISFVYYFYIIKGYYQEVKKNIETKTFLLIMVIASVIVTTLLYANDSSSFSSRTLLNGIFQVISFATTSGFSIVDYQMWPETVNYIFFALTIIGGCSASTSGSMKVLRILIMSQLIRRGFHKRLHPRLIEPVKVGDSIISAPLAASVTTYGLLFFALTIFSTFVLSLQGLDLETTFSAALSGLTNIGVGFGQIGYLGDYSMFHPMLKIYLCIEMIIGRLGLFTVFLIFMPSFWGKRKKSSRIISSK